MPRVERKNSQRTLFADLWEGRTTWVFVFAFSLLLRVLSLMLFQSLGYQAHTKSDMAFYHLWAVKIASGEPAVAGAFFGLPGYAYLAGAVYAWFGPVPMVLTVLQGVADSLTAVLIFAISRMVITGRPGLCVGALAALGWALFPPARAYALVLMPTSWFIAAFWFLIYVVLPAKGRRVLIPFHGLVLGLMVGLVGSMVATIFLLIPLIIAALWARVVSVRGFFLASLLLFVGIGLGTAPVWYHNRFVAKEPVLLSAHGGINFYVGNQPAANGYPRVPTGMRASQAEMQIDARAMAESEAGRPLKAWEASQFWRQKGMDFIRTQPAAWLHLMGLKFHNFWRAWSYDDLGIVEVFLSDGVISLGPGFGVIAAWGLPGLILLAVRRRLAWWLLAAVGLHLLALMPVFITERYRVAVIPGLLIGASWLLVFIWQSLSRKRWAQVGRTMVFVGAMSWFVACSPRDASLFAVQKYTSGIWALDRGDLDTARNHLEKAWRHVPDNSETNFALGNFWFMKRNFDRAKIFYRRTLELISKHDGALHNMGVIAWEAMRYEEAESCFEAALAVHPGRPGTWFLLAKARNALGKREAAMEALKKAIQTDSQREEYHQLLREWTGR